jgi:hypothetical protein
MQRRRDEAMQDAAWHDHAGRSDAAQARRGNGVAWFGLDLQCRQCMEGSEVAQQGIAGNARYGGIWFGMVWFANATQAGRGWMWHGASPQRSAGNASRGMIWLGR